MCTTTNCENGFVSETKSPAHVQEKTILSGGGLDSSLLRWLPPAVVNDAKKAGVKETVWLKCCLPPWQTSTRPHAQAPTWVSKRHHLWQPLTEALK